MFAADHFLLSALMLQVHNSDIDHSKQTDIIKSKRNSCQAAALQCCSSYCELAHKVKLNAFYEDLVTKLVCRSKSSSSQSSNQATSYFS